jgi:hypothetical protein
MYALDSAYSDSPGASPSLSDWPSAAYGVNASLDRAAWTDAGGAGRPTLGVLTVTSGPLDASAVQADRPAQQQIRSTRAGRARIFISSERTVVHACRNAASGLVRAPRRAG